LSKNRWTLEKNAKSKKENGEKSVNISPKTSSQFKDSSTKKVSISLYEPAQ
jgi:hypothetical protein